MGFSLFCQWAEGPVPVERFSHSKRNPSWMYSERRKKKIGQHTWLWQSLLPPDTWTHAHKVSAAHRPKTGGRAKGKEMHLEFMSGSGSKKKRHHNLWQRLLLGAPNHIYYPALQTKAFICSYLSGTHRTNCSSPFCWKRAKSEKSKELTRAR